MLAKRITLLVTVLILMGGMSYAQKLAYVDSEYIMKHIPEYATAQKKLDDLSQQWQKEVDKQYEDVERLYQAYQQDQPQLSQDLRRRREDDIVNKEKAAKEFQRTKFGFEGELFQQREVLMKPIQAKVDKALQDLAVAEQIDFIFDKKSENSFLYSNPKMDKSNDVIIKLGLKPNPAFAN
ncbi:OmpH family outer membrane protein [Sphingobacterium sp. HJSM2_6]|uniref:OmpH family outer membrane protein n=1 Tax=Sphingobacterium sp. HJSM2_6 TaxID=3366264 RepID=UPI003BD55CC6